MPTIFQSDFSKRMRFSNWSNANLPAVSAGVYAIWDNTQLIYCGMSGRQIEKAIEQGKSKYGLVTRLNSHASGRLSGDQFCVYVANRLVIPQIKSEDLAKFATGEYKLDTMTKKYIHTHFEYQYVIVGTSSDAYDIENKARRGELFGVKPFFESVMI